MVNAETLTANGFLAALIGSYKSLIFITGLFLAPCAERANAICFFSISHRRLGSPHAQYLLVISAAVFIFIPQIYRFSIHFSHFFGRTVLEAIFFLNPCPDLPALNYIDLHSLVSAYSNLQPVCAY